MRSSSAFFFGAIAGAFAVLAAQKFLNEYEANGGAFELVEKMDQRLQELEDRLEVSPEEVAS